MHGIQQLAAVYPRRIMVCLLLAVFVLGSVVIATPPACAAQEGDQGMDIAGKWYLSFDSAMGPMNWVAAFEQEGNEFSGTCDIGMGEMPVKEGRVEGNRISFVVELNMPGHEMPLSFDGTVEGDEASGILTGMGDDQEWTGTRKK